MELTRGLVVKALAGRDKGGYYVVVGVEGRYAAIADGKRRKLEAPKRKNIRHLQRTNCRIDMKCVTDKKLRSVLKGYQQDNVCAAGL